MKKLTVILVLFLGIAAASLGCRQAKESEKAAPPTNPEKSGTVETGPKTVGILRNHGKLLKMKEDGSGDEVTADVVLSNGTKVTKEGTILLSDGRKLGLPEGSLIQMDGTMQGNDPVMP